MKKNYFAIAAILISVTVGFYAASLYFTAQNEKTSLQIVEFVQVTMDTYLSAQDETFFRQHCSEEYNAILTSADLAQYVKAMEYLGAYRQILAINSDSENLMAPTSPSESSFNLVVETEFEADTANLLLELVMEDGDWKINRFSIQAQVLMI